MAQRLTSRQPVISPADLAVLDTRVGGLHPSLLDFLGRHNVAVPAQPRWFAARLDFDVRHFLGISPVPAEDFAAVHEFYKGRLADGHVPIADADGGNLVCMDVGTGRIFYWDHEAHDRGDDPDDDEPPVELAPSLAAFLEALGPAAPPAVTTPGASRVTWKSPDFDTLFKDDKLRD